MWKKNEKMNRYKIKMKKDGIIRKEKYIIIIRWNKEDFFFFFFFFFKKAKEISVFH